MALKSSYYRPTNLLRHKTRCLSSLTTSLFDPDSLLNISCPAYMLWGANTSVGKTLVSAGLSASLLTKSTHVLYLKPLQTGFPLDSDSHFVAQQVPQLLLNTTSSTNLFVSTYIQKASSTVLQSKPNWQSYGEPLPLVHKLAIRDVESYGMKDLFFHKEHVLGGYKGASHLICTTLWSWHHAVSPHLAAEQEGSVVSDLSVLQSLRRCIFKFSEEVKSEEVQSSDGFRNWTIVETAGGVASPAPSGTLQCDLYRPIRLPVVLVGDGRLGGISSTIAAYESLQLRGYDVAAIIVVDSELGNHKFLSHHLCHKVPVIGLPSLPQKPSENLEDWFKQSSGDFSMLQQVLELAHLKRIERLQEMPRKAVQLLWWPFTQHSHVRENDITVIDSRVGDCFAVYKETTGTKTIMHQFDACASWWTQGPDTSLQLELAKQIAYAAGRYGHVMLPENVYDPVLRCAELLLEKVGGGWADRVCFSDNGSTAIEIALKMAFRKFLVDNNYLNEMSSEMLRMSKKHELRVMALQGSYHGDTLGAQNVQSPSAYVGFLQQPWYQGRGVFLEAPSIYQKDRQWHLFLPNSYPKVESGDLLFPTRESFYDGARKESKLARLYIDYILKHFSTEESFVIGALVMEPVVHAAGGMNFVDPLFQQLLVRECKAKKIPVIFDEVFSGCWRLGVQSASQLIGCTPDIACYSKLLTGGTVPLAATLCSRPYFQVFEGESKLSALLHGHSYSGHAVGCQAAVTALQWFSNAERNKNLVPSLHRLKELWDPNLVADLSAHASVKRVMSLGTVLALELETNTSEMGYSAMSSQYIVQALRQNGVYVRPLGNVIYLMCGPMTPVSICYRLLLLLLQQLDLYSNNKTS